MAPFQLQLVEAKKHGRPEALMTMKELCKGFVFTVGTLKGSLAEGRKKQ